jgi:hybrid polyketide synthase/nonribosomal peptide synthetase ACE1
MQFKVLDIEKDVGAQGFADRSFDLIVASWVIHATAKLKHTLRNVRRLLKPGGYLLMLEVTDNGPMKSSFIFGALPGWWLGAEDGRALSPCVSPAQWDVVLRKTGFSGIDAITPEHDRLPYPASLIASQAVDDRINLLRHPLSPGLDSLRSELTSNNVIILGGKTSNTSRLVTDLGTLLKPFFGQIRYVHSLDDFCTIERWSKTTVLSLTELDEPVFKDLTGEKFKGLKKVFEQAKTALWVTKGRRADEPFANMTVGFGRTQLWENPELRLQFLDIEAFQISHTYLLAEAFLRFNLMSTWPSETQKDLLWSTEPELLLHNEEYSIPRLLANKQQNDRYNSSRRFITKDVDPQKFPVGIAYSEGSFVLQEERRIGPHIHGTAESCVSLHTNLSLLSSIKVTENSYLFLLFGRTIGANEQVLGLSEIHTSSALIPRKWTVPCHIPVGQEVQFISSVVSNLIALSIVPLLSSGETLLVHEPEPIFAAILARHAAQRSIHVLYTTVSPELKSLPWVPVHPRAPRRVIKSLIPQSVSVFIDFSTSIDSKSIASSIVTCLPPYCKRDSTATLFHHDSHVSSAHSADAIQDLLKAAWLHSHDDISMPIDNVATKDLALGALSQRSESTFPPDSVVNWGITSTIQVQVRPVDARPLFAMDKTYWLVGLTQGLGLSLCEWMIRHGARFVVLTSRTPKIDNRWFEKMESLGATVRCYAKYRCLHL